MVTDTLFDYKIDDNKEKNIIPCYVKFYKYEELKEKNQILSYKDKLRVKMKDKLKGKRQYEMEKNLNINFEIDPDLIENLNRTE